MNERYQIAVASVGDGLEGERINVIRSVIEMGHWAVDLTGTGILEHEQWETVERHLDRSDYIVLIAAPSRTGDHGENRAGQLCKYAGANDIPVLALLPPRASTGLPDGDLMQSLRKNTLGLAGSLEEKKTSVASLLNRMIATYERPGWLSASEIPKGNVAEVLSDLIRENEELRDNVIQETDEERERREKVTRILEANRILIPLWERGAHGWGQPVEMTLYDFFLRMGPELAGEISTLAAAEFIPVGVCGLDREDFRSKWPVPSNNLNLWFTDLMALGLVEPSIRTRRSKDESQFWALTRAGRNFLSHVRRTVLFQGGHRHSGFTSEFPIVPNMQVDR